MCPIVRGRSKTALSSGSGTCERAELSYGPHMSVATALACDSSSGCRASK